MCDGRPGRVVAVYAGPRVSRLALAGARADALGNAVRARLATRASAGAGRAAREAALAARLA